MKPIIEKVHHADPKGFHLIYRFENNHGASVVRFFGSLGYDKGLWELAEIVFHSEDNDDWSLIYDVQGFLTWAEVHDILKSIAGESV
jgi:hypothetical protein